MIRQIIHIDEEKCNGCGACVKACHEGAIGMINGKAKLLRDDYCDGLGDCLPKCPVDAISFEEREALAYDEDAVKEHLKRKEGQLGNWPVQIKLAPVKAPYFDGASLLIAADCSAFAYADFHKQFIDGKITLVGCPKLDGIDYSEKLAAIIKFNNIKDILLVRMDVPCCGGLKMALEKAVNESGKSIPLSVTVISRDGRKI